MVNYDQFKQFIVDNNIIGICSGMVIALSSKDLIQTIIANLVVPGLYLFLLTLKIKFLTKLLPGNDAHTKIDFIPFINALLTFVLTIIITFLFVFYTFNKMMGIKGKSKTEVDISQLDVDS